VACDGNKQKFGESDETLSIRQDGDNIETMKRKLFLNTTTSLLSQFITLIVGFILPRFILEQYGSEVNGLTQSIKQFLTIISFLDMGVGQVMRSALYVPLEKKDNMAISRVVVSGKRFYRKIAGYLSVYVIVLVFIYPLFVERKFDWFYTGTLILVLSISSFAQYYFGLADSLLLLADQKGYISFLAQIASTISKLLICILLIKNEVSIHILQLAIALVFLIKPLITGIYVRKNYQINYKVTYDTEPISQKWNGFAQHISSVVLESTDNIILTVFSTLTNVSIYSVYYMVIAGIMQIYTSLTSGIQSAAGALWAKAEKHTIYSMFEMIEIILHMITVFVFGCTAVLLVPFVQVYTQGLTDANYIQPAFATVLTLAYAVRCLRTPYNIWILAAGHYRQTQKCHITATVLNIMISIAALQKWGLVGIAIGTLVALVYQTIWMAVYVTNHLVSRSKILLIKQVCIDCIMFRVLVLLTGQIQLREMTYLGFLIMAMKVVIIALAVLVAIVLVFYKDKISKMGNLKIKKLRGRHL